MAVRLGSIVSGLPPNLVEKLVELERTPILKLEQKKAFENARLELVNDLKGKVSKIGESLVELGTERAFRDLLAISSDPKILTATVDKDIADPGLYRFEVLELAERSSAISNGFPDRDETQMGVGFFNIELANGETRSIYVDSGSNTLNGIAALINENKAELGLRARVINDGSNSDEPWRLAVVGQDFGHDGKVEFPTFYFLDGDQEFYFDRFENSKTARIKFDGFEIQADENTIKDLIPGVNIELLKAAPGEIVTLKITEDIEKITGKVSDFIERVNAVLMFINKQNQLDESSDTRMTLGGDSMLQMLETRVRRTIFSMIPGIEEDDPANRLSDFGIQFQRGGNLALDRKKFENALANRFEVVAHHFVGDRRTMGIVPQMRTVIRAANDRANGFLSNRADGLRSRMRRYDNQIEQKEKIAARRGQSIRQKFAALENAMASFKSQGSALNQLGGQQAAGINLSGATITST